MLFTELRFLFFFVLAFGIHWALRKNAIRKPWLLICSYAFYAGWDWRFLGLIVASTVIDYVVGRSLKNEQPPMGRKFWLILSLCGNLGILSFFKYYNFFVDSAADFAELLGLSISTTTLEITLPVGISFYTFQTLSYTIDVYRGRLKPINNFLDFALFVAFFPQLVAGPIVRAADFLPQLAERRRFRDINFRFYLTLFLFGYIKKACVADHFGMVVDRAFATPEAFVPLDMWLALIMYGVQIYCDFSGYSDMAIATAGLFGYQLAVNFNFPYLASSVTEFWRRWHISLSSWFRDYLYIPLGGNRVSKTRTGLNLVMVFFLCGLWHGAKWNFVIWGLFHGLFLVIERVVGHKSDRGGGVNLLGRAYTLVVVLLAWVFFRATDLEQARQFMVGLVGLGPQDSPTAMVNSYWWPVVLGFSIVHVAMYRQWLHQWFRNLPDLVFSVLYGAFVAVALLWAAASYQPFIYFQF